MKHPLYPTPSSNKPGTVLDLHVVCGLLESFVGVEVGNEGAPSWAADRKEEPVACCWQVVMTKIVNFGMRDLSWEA